MPSHRLSPLMRGRSYKRDSPRSAEESLSSKSVALLKSRSARTHPHSLLHTRLHTQSHAGVALTLSLTLHHVTTSTRVTSTTRVLRTHADVAAICLPHIVHLRLTGPIPLCCITSCLLT